MPAPELTKPGHDVEELLPFYAAGTLEAPERRTVEAALAADAELRRRLALVEDERNETILLNESLRGPSTQVLDRLIASLDAEPKAAPLAAGLIDRFASWMQGLAPRRLAFAVAAAALAVALQAGALIGLMTSRPSGGFETASHGGQPAPPRADLALMFAEDGKAAEIAALLTRHGLVIVDGPRAGGLYLARVGAGAPAPAELEALLATLRAQTGLVRLASPAPRAD